MTTAATPLERALLAQLRVLHTTHQPSTVHGYRLVIRDFLAYLQQRFPQLTQPRQLRRDPHLLGWLEALWTYRTRQDRPLHPNTRVGRVLQLRVLLDRMRDSLPYPLASPLLLPSDVPKPQLPLPRPLNADDDARLRAHWDHATGLLDTALALMRLTGIRIGECVDLSPDCLRHLGGQRWSLHVPHGKPRSERWVPLDDTARALVERLAFLRTLAPGPPGDFLLPRPPRGRAELMQAMRTALSQAAADAGLQGHIVPHQLRHTYATSLLRAGISLPSLMRLLGHHTANVTLRYVEITQADLHREYQAAQQHPRYLTPSPPAFALAQTITTPDSIDNALVTAMGLLQRQRDTADHAKLALLLIRRLTRIRSLVKKLVPDDRGEM
jgi:site-specific recombinase XerD